MPKPHSKRIAVSAVFDAPLDKLPGDKKTKLAKIRAKELSQPIDYPEETFEQELEMKDVDDFMRDLGDR